MSMPGTGEMTTVSFVDEELRALKTEMPMAGMNVELVACAKEFALGDNQVFEIVDKMFLASPEPIEDVRSAKSITYYLKPVGGAGSFTIPASDNQRVERLEDGSVKVVVEPVSAPAGAKFPYKGTDKEIIEATRPSRFLQSDDAKIIAACETCSGRHEGRGGGGAEDRAFCGGLREEHELFGWVCVGVGGGGEQEGRLHGVCGIVRGDVPVGRDTCEGCCGRGIRGGFCGQDRFRGARVDGGVYRGQMGRA